MNRTNVLWIGLLCGALLFGCSDDGGSDGGGGAGAAAGSDGGGGSAGSGGTGGVGGDGSAGSGGIGGVDGAFGAVNVDFMSSVLPMFGDEVYVGDDGALSSPGGTYWNPSDAFTSVPDVDDEFGDPTPIDLVVNAAGGIFIGAAQNELQDDGIVNQADDLDVGFDWRDLMPDGVYDLAFYVHAHVLLEAETRFDVTHAGGTTSLGPNEEPTWMLPGEAGKDYLLLEGLSPYEISAGVYGFRINNINVSGQGAILGAQLVRTD